MEIKILTLDSIILEESFIKDLVISSLLENIRENGLTDKLVVEGPTINNKYVLVHGYRRYACLQQLGIPQARCKIQCTTNESNRIMQRLGFDIHTKKKTGIELERITKSLSIDPDLIKRAEEEKVGRDGLVRLMRLPNISQKLIRNYTEKYFRKEFFGYHVDFLEYVANNSLFKFLPEKLQEICFNEAISTARFDDNKAKDIVYTQNIKNKYDQEVADFLYEKMLKDLEKIISDSHPNIMNNLNDSQEKALKNRINTLNKLLSKEKDTDTNKSAPEVRISTKLHKYTPA